MTEQNLNLYQRIPTIVEDIDPAHMIDALKHNYRDAQSAFMELIDNAVDNRIESKPLRVTIKTKGSELTVANMGGKGLDIDGLRKFFTWGSSDKRQQEGQIGRYGQGGKAAMGYLGDSLQVVCSPQDSNVAYIVTDSNWNTRDAGKLKEYTPRAAKAVSTDGYFNVTVSQLRRKVDAQQLHKKLGEVYSPLLRSVEGAEPQVKMSINGKEIVPYEIPYKVDDPLLVPEIYGIENRLGLRSSLTVGILDDEVDDVEPGIRCYVHGKLITKGRFFGVSTSIPGSSRLTGEVHLDYVPVTANKSDFDEDSEEWKAASQSIEALLKDRWVEKLKLISIEKGNQPSKDEIILAKKMKSEFESFLKETGFFTSRDLAGTSSGRIPPFSSGETRPAPKGGTHATPEGKTPPDQAASEGRDKTKRWGPFDDWEPKSMGNVRQRAAIVTENDRTVLRINTDYLAYQKTVKAGIKALDVYYLDTIAMEIGKQLKNESVEDYYAFVTDMVRLFTEYRDNSEKSKQGVIFTKGK